MNNFEIFNSTEFGNVRTIMKDGEPWFVGKDVASALEYKDTKHAISDHVDEEDRRIFSKSEIEEILRGQNTTLENNQLNTEEIQRSQNTTFEIPNRGLILFIASIPNLLGSHAYTTASTCIDDPRFIGIKPTEEKLKNFLDRHQQYEKDLVKTGTIKSDKLKHETIDIPAIHPPGGLAEEPAPPYNNFTVDNISAQITKLLSLYPQAEAVRIHIDLAAGHDFSQTVELKISKQTNKET